MDALMIAMMIQIIITITLSMALGFCLALFSYFLDFCFLKGNVFAFWLPFLAKQILKQIHPAKAANIAMISDKEERQSAYLDAIDMHPLFKMLGGCAICFNIWIGFATFPLLAIGLGLSFWYWIPYLLSASFFLRKIMKVF